MSIDTLKQVEVKGKKDPVKRSRVNPLQSLDKTELERINSITVADAVKHLSGVQLKDYGGVGGLKTINVRSLGSLHTAIMYDGVQLGNVQNGQIDLSKFSLDNVESLELYNGQSDNLLQPARAFSAANVLYIKSKAPVFAEGRTNAGKASFKTGSFGLINPALSWNHKLSKRTALNVSSEWIDADGRYKFRYVNGPLDTMLARKNADVSSFRAEAGIYTSFADSSSLKVKFFSFNSNRGLPAVMGDVLARSVQRFWDNDLFVQSTYETKPGRKADLLLNARYSNNYNRYSDVWYPVPGGLNNRYQQDEYYVSAALRYHLSKDITTGLAADVFRSTMSASLPSFPHPTRWTKLVALSSSVEKNWFELQGSLLGTFTSEKLKEKESDANRQVLSPSVSLALYPFHTPNFKILSFYKEIFRLPTFNDQYYTLSGNSNLKPEYVHQVNVGVAYTKSLNGTWQYLQLQLNAWHSNIKDRILATPKAGIFWTMENIGRVEVKGVELNLKAALHVSEKLSLSGNVNYTYQQATDLSTDQLSADYYGKEIPYSPEHSGALTLALASDKYGINYNFIYSGEYYTGRPNLRSELADPWYTHDVSAYMNGKLNRSRYRVSGEINNLFNYWYSVVRNYPMPGRSFRVSLSFFY